MKQILKELLAAECNKHIRRFHERIAVEHKYRKNFQKRTGKIPTSPPPKIPRHWEVNQLFNPFYVRSRIDCIAHTLATKIRSQEYLPQPSLIVKIPKKSGRSRKISIFTIPDSVVAKHLFDTLLARNIASLSSYAFAYRYDRNIHNAIEHLYQSVQETPRKYILEYDFAEYFDSIRHEYILNVLKEKTRISQRELKMVDKFLKYQFAEGVNQYTAKHFTSNLVGIPQGSTLSLFLANIACLELDKKIESEGGTFARYSDDSIVLCRNYEQANQCANFIISHGDKSGTKVNFEKSKGINILTHEDKSEFRSSESFEFCGHKVSSVGITLRDSSKKKIKRRVSQTINQHLIHYPKRHGISASRYDAATETDWDLVTCINELRRYIYGFLQESHMTECLMNKGCHLRFTKSVTSFYPLVDKGDVFKSLDGWLVSTILGALRTRKNLIAGAFPTYSPPTTDEEIISGSWYKGGLDVEVKLPSFHKSWLYTRKLMSIYGVDKFPNPEYY